jgi:septal ring factor EnvC (AmiA/AmiB activator)
MNKNFITKIFLITFIALIVTSLSLAGTQNQTTEKKINLNQIQKKIDDIDKKIEKNKETKEGLNKDLKKQEKKISKTKKEIKKIKNKEKKNKKKLTKLNKEIKKLKKELTVRKERQSEILYQSYIKPKPGYLQMFLEGVNPNKITRDINYLGYLSRSYNENITKINDTYKKIKEKKKTTNKIIKKISSFKQKKLKKNKKLIKQKKAKKNVINKISKKIKSQKNLKKKLIADEKKLTTIIKKLLEKSKKKSAKKSKSKKSIKDNNKISNNKFDGINFAKLKNKLRLPVKGKVTNKFGSKRKDTGVTYKGIFIKAPEGGKVYAVAKGKVVFANALKGYGNIIILDHGNQYMSLYGNNKSLNKKENDIVKGGETIALVGNSGGNNANGLYYELRKKSKPFDPLKWTKNK